MLSNRFRLLLFIMLASSVLALGLFGLGYAPATAQALTQLKLPATPETIQADIVISHTVTVEDPGGRTGYYLSMATIGGKPAMAFHNGTAGQVQFMLANDADGTSWGEPINIRAVTPFASGIVLREINGKPAVIYDDVGTDALTYIQATSADGSSWGTPVTVDQVSPFGTGYIDLEVVAGQPAVSYAYAPLANSNLQLRYARANDADGGSWGTPQILDNSQPIVGAFSQLEVVDGFPAIAYQNSTLGNLMFLRAQDATGSSWGTPQLLANAGTAGQQLTMAIIAGQPAIVYRDGASGDLRYTRATTASGSSWGAPVTLHPFTISGGAPPHLTTINGLPAVAFQTGGAVYFQRANDATGSSWPAPTTIYTGSTSSDGVYYLNLQMVNGRPAIAGQNSLHDAVAYLRADNAAGTSWGSLRLLLGGLVGNDNSLALVGGRPAISYADSLAGGLRYARAADATGTSWETPISVDPTLQTGEGSQLLVVNGQPAITYLGDNGNLRYVRATDAVGSSWPAPQSLIADGAYLPNLAIFTDRPTIVYYDYNASEIRRLRANDADGTTWGSPLTIASLNSNAIDSEDGNLLLFSLNGNPAIVYSDSPNNTIHLIRANDAAGNSWGAPAQVATGGEGDGLSYDFHEDRLALLFYYWDSANSEYQLTYVRATDLSASSWATPVTIHAQSGVNNRPFLTWINGAPAALYVDRQTDQWQLLRSTDASGTSWGTPQPVLPNYGDADILRLDEHAFAFSNGSDALHYLYYQLETQFKLYLPTVIRQ
ncbi:MAG: hypothetical protein KDE04_13525 [Anaerolineales bacterium]|nr:hypothetical protein [Anaerolineales bacterium]MCB8961611.1 hypothetical protein [Ardenticatenales bacterium]